MANMKDLLPVPKGLNDGVTSAGNSFMLSAFGNPRSNYTSECQPVTNKNLKQRIVLANVGPFRVQGLDSAVEDLKLIFAKAKETLPDVYSVLGTAGMLCPRLIRGSATSISNHSFGTAIDLTIGGELIPLGKPKVQRGLLLLYPLFHEHGWFWGASFHRTDSMHFEAGKSLVSKWAGKVPAKVVGSVSTLQMGDRSDEVAALQKKLNALGEKLVVDGVFGAGTRAAVIAFQAKNKLRADGIVGSGTQTMLYG